MRFDRLSNALAEPDGLYDLICLYFWPCDDEEENYYPDKEYDDAIEEIERLEELELLRRYGE
ncbi:hypothetical protein [Paraburkholderia sp.]|jgi:hypothetical protein|uniref:hypothetical protein n=1 Tax=Paraburkholderia sp. TaxID=1926495 RepID=UPI003C7E3A3B